MMDVEYGRDGFFGLRPEDIHEEALRLYDDFFQHQTPIKDFRLALVLFHILEWIVPNGNDGARPSYPPAPEDGNWAEELRYELRNYSYYEVLPSLANNSKHHTLRSRSRTHEKGATLGFRAGRSTAGECVGQPNLAVWFEGEEVWLREVFDHVLRQYTHYFERVGPRKVIADSLKREKL